VGREFFLPGFKLGPTRVMCVSGFTTSLSYATHLRMQVVKYRVGHYYQYLSKSLGYNKSLFSTYIDGIVWPAQADPRPPSLSHSHWVHMSSWLGLGLCRRFRVI
jgi:hypothetical protein